MKHTMLTTLLLGALAHPAAAQTTTEDKTRADDLAKAADATADVANTPAPATEASSAAAKAAADVDLSALGLDPASAASAYDDKLNVYGFADFSYQAFHFVNPLMFIRQDTRGFAVGNLNLYLAKNLTPRVRALAEVRFTFLPNGSTNRDGTTVDDTAADVANYSRPVQWGGVVIERVYVEYDLTDWLTIRAGHWLTPYGIWNIDHGSPAIIPIGRPYIIGEQFFPEHQTGLDLFGSKLLEGYKVAYHVTASNGRGATESIQDQDNKLAFGARAELETPWGLRIGGSYYRGRYTGVAPTVMSAAPTFKEQAIGGDVQFDYHGLHAQAEVIGRIRDFHGQRPMSFGGDNDFGSYLLAGYRFDALWNVMPFVLFSPYEPADLSTFKSATAGEAGLNFRPSGNLILKVQGIAVKFDDDHAGLLSNNTVYQGMAEASFVF